MKSLFYKETKIHRIQTLSN